MGDRARKGEIEPDGHFGQGREQGGQLRARGGVALDAGVALLEEERGREHERLFAREHAGEVAHEYHHGLGVDGAAQIRLALEVDDAVVAHAHGAGDAVRQAELEGAVGGHGQAVDLAYGLSLGLHLDGVAVVLLHVELFDQARAVVALGVGLLEHGARDLGQALHLGKGRRLDHVLAQDGKLEREALLVVAEVGTEVHEPGHGRPVEGRQPLEIHDAAYGAKVVAHAGGASRHAVGHLGLDAEELGKALVGVEQAFVDVFVADEHDLELKLDRGGLEALGAHGRVRQVLVVLEPGDAGLEGAQQAFPGCRVVQEIVHVEHQEAAVGAVEAAGLDEREVRDQGAELGFALDAAEQVGRRRVVLHDDGGALEALVVHEEVHAAPRPDVGPVRRHLGLACGSGILGRGKIAPLVQEGVGVLQEVFAQILEVGFKRRRLAGLEAALGNGLEHGVEHGCHDAALEVLLLAGVAFLHLGQLVHEARHVLGHGFGAVLEGKAQAGVETFELVFGDAPALDQGIEGDAAGVVHVDVEALVLGHAVHAVEQLGALVLVGFEQLLALLDEALPAHAALQSGADLLDAVLHGLAELRALAGGEGHEHGAVGILEVVDVDQIRGRGRLLGQGLEVLAQKVHAAELGVASEVDVEAAGLDVDGQIQGLHGPVLEGRAAFRRRGADAVAVVGRHEGRVVGGVQSGRGERLDGGHGVLPFWMERGLAQACGPARRAGA